MSKRTTMVTAKAAIRKYCGNIPEDKIEVDSRVVTIWTGGDPDLRQKAEVAIKKIARHCKSSATGFNGSKWWCYYKRSKPVVKGAWCDRTSRYHY